MNTLPPDLADTDTAPEVPPGLEGLQTWDEPPTATGTHIPSALPEDEADPTALVEEGIEEADRETRLEDELQSGDDEMPEDTAPPVTGILS